MGVRRGERSGSEWDRLMGVEGRRMSQRERERKRG